MKLKHTVRWEFPESHAFQAVNQTDQELLREKENGARVLWRARRARGSRELPAGRVHLNVSDHAGVIAATLDPVCLPTGTWAISEALITGRREDKAELEDKSWCSGRNVCIPLKFIGWRPNSQCDGIWRCGLWEMVRVR